MGTAAWCSVEESYRRRAISQSKRGSCMVSCVFEVWNRCVIPGDQASPCLTGVDPGLL
jgi:hypothetical protein